VKTERLHRLQAVIDRHQARFNARFQDATVGVLLEKPGKLSGQLVGRSPYLQPVQVMAPASLVGEVVAVRIDEVGANSLFGSLINAPRESDARLLAVAAGA
jgi:tRNA-2-methylthio-N6-dimethylallyladenosine synthase